MRTYETATVWSTSLTESELEKELTRVQEIISAEDGTYRRTDSWGRRQLAYPIRKQTEGVYVFLYWEGDERVTAGIDKHLRINDVCLRYLTLRRDRTDDVPVPAARERTAAPAAAAEEPADAPEEAPVDPFADEEEEHFPVEDVAEPQAEEPAQIDCTDQEKPEENGGE